MGQDSKRIIGKKMKNDMYDLSGRKGHLYLGRTEDFGEVKLQALRRFNTRGCYNKPSSIALIIRDRHLQNQWIIEGYFIGTQTSN